MKVFVFACVLVAVTTASTITAHRNQQRRDVSELVPPVPNYLPPHHTFEGATTAEPLIGAVTEVTTVASASHEPESAVLGGTGYEYRAVRHLKYRLLQRRDVSHLTQNSLPLSNEYLSPKNENHDAVPRLTVEYLPPIEEAETSTAPALELVVKLAVASPVEVVEAEEEEEEVPQNTAVLAAEGYHYKQPKEAAALKMGENLPPSPLSLANVAEVVQSDADASGEGAVLAADGYRYRAVKRLRF